MHRLYDLYLEYTAQTESPRNYHRWVFTSVLGTLIGRRCWVPFGPWKIYPNQYILLVGPPGVRKGSAISLGKKLLGEIDYEFFGPDRAAKEMLWYEMARMAGQIEGVNGHDNKGAPKDEDIFAMGLEDIVRDTVAEMYVCADEFTAFTGSGNEEFIINLTNLWDNLKHFKNPKLTSQSVTVYNPTLNILSGTTPENMAEALPKSAIGSGFTARTLLIHSARGKKIDWPPEPDKEIQHTILTQLLNVERQQGPIEADAAAKELLSDIYHHPSTVVDRRFEHFHQRRQTHLLKQCLIAAVSRGDDKIRDKDVMLANTVLHLAEKDMPLALGHFGKSLNSGRANAVLEAVYHSSAPMDFRELWKVVAQDCAKETELKEILRNLVAAEKIQVASTKLQGKQKRVYLPMRTKAAPAGSKHVLVDYSLVSEEERPH